MSSKYASLLIILVLIFSCKEEIYLNKIEGKRLKINETLASDSAMEKYIEPYRKNVNRNLDSVISYAPETYSKKDGNLNTAIGNLMADAVFSEANPVFNKRTGQNIDFVILNHGGIRSMIPKGNITTRTAYNVMPFENSVVVVELKGKQINQMLTYLSKAKRAHPLSNQIKIEVDANYNVVSATISNQEVLEDKTYFIATNDYLYNGGDRMTFFHPNDSLHVLDFKIRNVLIDYFKKNDTISPIIDNRFTQKPN